MPWTSAFVWPGYGRGLLRLGGIACPNEGVEFGVLSILVQWKREDLMGGFRLSLGYVVKTWVCG